MWLSPTKRVEPGQSICTYISCGNIITLVLYGMNLVTSTVAFGMHSARTVHELSMHVTYACLNSSIGVHAPCMYMPMFSHNMRGKCMILSTFLPVSTVFSKLDVRWCYSVPRVGLVCLAAFFFFFKTTSNNNRNALPPILCIIFNVVS